MRSRLIATIPLSVWLQRHSPRWPFALGMLGSLGLYAWVLWGLGGVIGVGVCLAVVGVAYQVARKAAVVRHEEERGSAPVGQHASVEPALLLETPSSALWWELLNMVALPGGTFAMGVLQRDVRAREEERPQHEVAISALWISRYLITRQLYRDILGRGPRQWQGDPHDERLPANYVSWFEAVAFCNALSARAGLQPCYHIIETEVVWDTTADGYRLPTEAEWEYACRAGTATGWFCGEDMAALSRYAWFVDTAGDTVHPVGEKEPNPWGLQDMIGNVWEWCWDWHAPYDAAPVSDPVGPETGISRVLRGGSSWDTPWFLRSSNRDKSVPEDQDDDIGFRCVRRPRRQL